jgi:hypothetical protein
VSGDIVERLRDVSYCGTDHCEAERSDAADEIERLRAEFKLLRAAGDALAEAVGDDADDPWILATFEAWMEARRER